MLSHDNLNSEFVVRDLLSKNNVSWLLATVSRDEGGAFGEVSEVSGVVEGLDGVRSDVTISPNSQIESSLLKRRESRVDWASQRSGQEAKVDFVEVFLFSLRAVEVDVSLWVFLIHGHVSLDSSLEKSRFGDSVISVSSMSIDRFSWNSVWHKDSGSQESWVPPSLPCVRINLVADGDVRFPEVSLLVGSPKTRFSGRGDGSWVLRRVLLFSALFVWPSVRSSFVDLSLGSVGLLVDSDFRSVGWAGSFLGFLTPDNVDGSFVSWLVDSFVVEEISNLGSLGSEVDTDNSWFEDSQISLDGHSGLDFDLLESSLGKGNSQIKSLGLGCRSSVLEVQGRLNLDSCSEFLLGVRFVFDFSLSFNSLEDGLGSRVLRVPGLKSTSLSWGREEERLEHVSGSESEESQRSS